MSWAAGFSLALEINRPVINLVLEKFLLALQAQLTYTRRLGRIGSFEAKVTKLEVLDFEDPPPLGGIITDLQATADFKLVLLGITFRPVMVFSISDVEVDLAKTSGGLPKGIVIKVTPSLAVNINFTGARFIIRGILNGIVAPLVSLGVWLAFRIIRKVEIPVWDLVDIFNVLGLTFASNSPLLTAQKIVPPTSLLLASDFNLTKPAQGVGANLQHFLPANTVLGAVIHEKVVAAAVQIAFAKGWVPSQFRVSGWKIYINSIRVEFEQDKIVASGSLKAKRGKCWCRVKAKITFKAAVIPKIIDATTNPKISFTYDAQINAQISTSGMLVVLGVIMFAPVFMALTLGMSFLINIVLDKFLPFSTSWNQSGLQLTITANSVNFSGFVPLSMQFPLQLSGSGLYELSRFRQFNLPNNGPQILVNYTTESLSLQKDELRLAIDVR